MLKNLPDFLNEAIHHKHIRFLMKEIKPQHVSILDVGCGWGRIAMDLKNARPQLNIEGVELDDNFSRHFSSTVGACTTLPVQSFFPKKHYDIILFVTSLMYLNRKEVDSVLGKMWNALNNDGKLICIEPATNLMTHIRKIINSKKYAPTGEDVAYFRNGELFQILSRLENAHITREKSIGFLPFLNHPVVHRAIVARK